jgi:hypothetical protein
MPWDEDDGDTLVEIVDALCDTLKSDPRTSSLEIKTIAGKARQLRNKKLDLMYPAGDAAYRKQIRAAVAIGGSEPHLALVESAIGKELDELGSQYGVVRHRK